MQAEILQKEYSRHFPSDTQGRELIARAYTFAEATHKRQKRASGDDYITHLYETALKLARWKMDAITISAGLLHDTLEDCGLSPDTLQKEFDEHITTLVEGVTKLGNLKYSGPEEHNAENMRRMMLAISKDLRVVFIKLADRLHNMETLHHIPTPKQKRIALETTEIYAPLATRLGMQGVAGELEDLAFPYLFPKEHSWLTSNIHQPHEARRRYLQLIEPVIKKHLTKSAIPIVRMDYRAKRMYSLFKKLHRMDMNLDQIYDLIALRIIVPTLQDCYATLGAIHELYPPMPGRIKDYIALPKPNGYQSLHTTVFSHNPQTHEDNIPVEIQIRTPQMHEHAEHGVAAHWCYDMYKSDKEVNTKTHAPIHDLTWISSLKQWQQQYPGSQEFMEALRIDIFSDRIFVLSPKGRVYDLPTGSTPIDFAYKIHTSIGNSCTGTKINNKMVSLDTPLQSGDIVEILTQKSRKPSESWLRFVKTANARKQIRSNIKQQKPMPKVMEYRIVGEKRIGLFKDISSVFSRNHITITQIETVGSYRNYPVLKIIADIKTKEKADDIVLKLKKITGIKEVSYKLTQTDSL